MYPQIVKALGGPPTLLYVTARANAADVALVLASPPVVVVGPRLASLRAGSRSDIDLSGDGALRFQLGRIVELSRPRRVFAGGQSPAAFALLIAALRHAFGPAAASAPSRDVISEAERLRGKLPVAVRGKLTERLAAGAALDARGYLAACERAADRAGLLVCGDVAIAIAQCGGSKKAAHLVKVAATQRYLAARRKLRARGLEETTQPFER